MSSDEYQKYLQLAIQVGLSKQDTLTWATDRVKADQAAKDKIREDRAIERSHEKEKLDIEVILEREKAARIEKELIRDREKLAYAKEQAAHEQMLEQGRLERESLIIHEKAKVERETLMARKDLQSQLFSDTSGRVSLEGPIGTSSPSYSSPFLGRGSLNLPTFSDKDDIVSYISRFEKYAEMTKLEVTQWSLHLGSLLTGNALQIFSSLPIDVSMDYYKLKSALLQGFAKTPDTFRSDFKSMKLGNESCIQYFARLKRAFREWVSSEGVDRRDPDELESFFLYDQFLASIPSELRTHLKERKFSNENDFLECGDLWLSAHKKSFTKPKFDSKAKFHTSTSPRSAGTTYTSPSNSKNVSNVSTHERKPVPKNDHVSKGTVCYGCGQVGHIKSQCKNPRSNNNNNSSNNDVANINFATIGNVAPEYMACGTVNGLNVSTIVRDTACEAVLISDDCLPNLTTENSETINVCDFLGNPTSLPVARCYISCPFFEGFVNAIRAPLKYCSVLIGNVPGASIMKRADEKHCMPNGNIPDCVNEACYDNSNSSSKFNSCNNTNVTDFSPSVNAITRQGSKRISSGLHPLKIPSYDVSDISPDKFKDLQLNCDTLVNIRKQADNNEYYTVGPRSYRFKWLNNLLYQVCEASPKLNEVNQALLVVPKMCRMKVLSTAHENLISGHFSNRKTLLKIRSCFYWPGMGIDVTNFCKSCDLCQRYCSKGRVKKVPLEKMPLISEPFYRISIDLVGPFSPPSEEGHRYILTIIDSATSFPEAIAMKNIDSISVADALLQVFSRVGIPREIHSDLGAQFASDLMKELYRLLGTQPLFNSPYHPMGTGRIERLHSTLKSALRKLTSQRPKDWHRYLIPVLFALREMPSDRTGFSSFELLYGRQVRGPITILKELWENPKLDTSERTVYQHVIDLKNRLKDSADLALQQSELSASKYKHYFDLKTQNRSLSPGDEALILLPSSSNKLLLSWLGPYKVVEKRGRVDYVLDQDGKHRLYHINLLKKYHRRAVVSQCIADRPEPYRSTFCQEIRVSGSLVDNAVVDGYSMDEPCIYSAGKNGVENLNSSDSVDNFNISENLNDCQREDIGRVIDEYSTVFSNFPGCTNLVDHDIDLIDKTPIRAKLYPVPLNLRDKFIDEVNSLIELGIIRPSKSNYCAPCLMVAKKDGGYRLAIDYRNLNSVTKFDAEPSCSLDEELHKFDNVKYFTELDICKAYYQVKLTESSIPLTAFSTPSGLYEFVRMPFGLVTACATYIRLMRKVLGDLDVSFYFDNILVYSKDWDSHIKNLRLVLDRLRNAGLTVKPSKCSFGVTSLDYLGFTLTKEGVRPQAEKVESIRNCNVPTTRTSLRSFIGLCSFYSRFIPNFSELTAPLTDLLKKGVSEPLPWNDLCERNFRKLIHSLDSNPILKFPCIDKTFVLRTDASGIGIGVILLQYHNEVPHPISFASRKLFEREQRYSTVERELLAVVYGIHKFRYYLIGKPFILETDHQPLVYLRKFKGSNARLMRWALALQAYEFRSVYIPGKENVGPDFLSRNI